MRQIIITLFLLFIFERGFAAVSIKVEPTRMEAGESTRLIITAESNLSQNYLPDLTPLTKDFTILSTEQRMSYSFVNGQTQSLNQWIIVILPKHHGLLSIPSLQIGNDRTQAATLEVIQTTDPPQEKLLLLTEVDQKNPYLNEQVIYTVKVLSNQDVVSTEYQPPQIDNAIVAALQDTKHYQTKVNNQDYAVEELRYAIFPQKSGEVTINPPSINALVYDQKLKRITIKEKTIPLNVKSVPVTTIASTWLPAREVNLSETYNTESTSLQEGSTLEREIIVKTKGLPAQLLPHMAFSSGPGFSVYAEKPQEQNEVDGENIIGITTIKLTYLLNKSGQATLPSFQLSWFNTVTGKEQVASLPEHKLSVMPSTASTTTPTSLSLPENAEKPPAQIPVRKTALAKPQTGIAFTHWLAIFFALAWLLTLTLWYRQKNRFFKKNHKWLAKQLKQACLTNQAAKARDLLLEWACLQWYPKKIINLVALEELLPEGELKQETNKLLQVLYSNTDQTPWKGEPLWGAIRSFEGNKIQKQSKDYPLPPLNQIH